jgi:hypothetical protein
LEKLRRILFIVVLMGIVLLGGGMAYFHYSKQGILWSNGLSAETIKLTMTNGNGNLQFYLYEKKQEIGFLVLRKRDSGLGWKTYNETSKLADNHQDSIKTLYPTIENGSAVAKSVWGGVVKGASSSYVTLKINGQSYQPDLVSFKKNDYLYFLVDTDKVEDSDTLTIEIK